MVYLCLNSFIQKKQTVHIIFPLLTTIEKCFGIRLMKILLRVDKDIHLQKPNLILIMLSSLYLDKVTRIILSIVPIHPKFQSTLFGNLLSIDEFVQ